MKAPAHDSRRDDSGGDVRSPKARADDTIAASLQLHDAPGFQRWSWRLQRAGWCAMALIVVLALVGVGGSGPLARTIARGSGVLTVDYARFARVGAVHPLVIRVAPARLSGESLDLFIDRRYLGGLRVRHVTPPPQRVVLLADAVRYSFAAAIGGRDLEVVLHVEPLRAGRQSARVWLPDTAGGDAAIAFEQFVWL